MGKKIALTWDALQERFWSRFTSDAGIDLRGKNVFGVPKGGTILVAFFASWSCTRHINQVFSPSEAEVIVDDILDSGRTRDRWKALFPNTPFIAAYDRQHPLPGDPEGWLVFPWETEEKPAEDAAVRLLQVAGEDAKHAPHILPALVDFTQTWVKSKPVRDALDRL